MEKLAWSRKKARVPRSGYGSLVKYLCKKMNYLAISIKISLQYLAILTNYCIFALKKRQQWKTAN